MSHSRIFYEYAKLMADKDLLKTAEKKDLDYDIIPDSAGPDTKVEETGWELTEIAHPEQIQVADSRLQDGIVENGVEQQKIMIDVALRNPRGVLASNLIKTLIKAADILDSEFTEESLKMASEIDDVLKKIAKAALSSEDIYPLVEEVLNRFGVLDFSTIGFSSEKNKAAKQTIYQISLVLKKFLQNAKTAGFNISDIIQGLATYIKSSDVVVKNALQNTTDWGADADEALTAWDNLKLITDEWYQKPEKKPGSEMMSPGVASKEKAHLSPVHNVFLKTPEVGQLQDALGFIGHDRDEKFGPHTFSKLQEAAKTNSLLDQFMGQDKLKSYQGWTNADIGAALKRIQDGKASVAPTINEPYSFMKDNSEKSFS